MKPSPCLSPVLAKKPDGSCVFVPCGHCFACLANKGLARSIRLDEHTAQYPFQFFVTLTYKDSQLPFGDIIDGKLVHSIDKDYNDNPHHLVLSDYTDEFSESFILKCLTKYGRIPLLSRSHLIKFKKRLNYYIRKTCKEKNIDYEPLFIYSVGEYGPSQYRPHFHLLLCTKSRQLAGILRECVYSSWSLRHDSPTSAFYGFIGKIDFQRVVGNGLSNYLATYLNCFTGLPKILTDSVFRPFYTKSLSVDSELSRFRGADLQSFFVRCSPEITYVSRKDDSCSVVPVPSYLENRYVPRFGGYSKVSYFDRVLLYATPFSIKDRNVFVEKVFNSISQFYNKYCHVQFYRLIYDLYFVGSCERTIRLNLSKLWYISRIVHNCCEKLNVSIYTYVKFIERYYSQRELFKLRNFYKLQQDLLLQGYDLGSLMSLYYDTSSTLFHLTDYMIQFKVSVIRSITHFKNQRLYADKCKKIVLDTSKTKKRNDHFDKTGRKRKFYIPKIKHSVFKFNSI